MNAVWNAFVNGLQGQFVQPVTVKGTRAQRYDMGRAVGQFAQEVEVEDTAKPAVKSRVKAQVKDAAKPTAGGSKADQVRAMIVQARADSQSMDHVVTQVIETLGMARALARTYVKNNWNKV